MKRLNVRNTALIAITAVLCVSATSGYAQNDKKNDPVIDESGPEFMDELSEADLRIPSQLLFQSRLKGRPLSDGTYNMTFRIYASREGGDSLWSETQSDVEIKRRTIKVLLGRNNRIDLPPSPCYYLGIETDDDGELNKRYTITGVPAI